MYKGVYKNRPNGKLIARTFKVERLINYEVLVIGRNGPARELGEAEKREPLEAPLAMGLLQHPP